MFSRRTVLLGGVAVGLTVILGSAIAVGLPGSQLRRAFAALVRRQAPGMSISTEDLERLVADFVDSERNSILVRNPLAGLAARLQIQGLMPVENDRVRGAEERLLRHLLLSTDLFEAHRNGARELRFVRSANPYRDPCGSTAMMASLPD